MIDFDFAVWALGWVVAVYYFVKYEGLRMRTDAWIDRAVSLARKQKIEQSKGATVTFKDCYWVDSERVDVMAKLEPSEN